MAEYFLLYRISIARKAFRSLRMLEVVFVLSSPLFGLNSESSENCGADQEALRNGSKRS